MLRIILLVLFFGTAVGAIYLQSPTPLSVQAPLLDNGNSSALLPSASFPSSAATTVSNSKKIQNSDLASSRGIPARENFGSAWQNDPRPEMAAFNEWARHFVLISKQDRAAAIAHGITLAKARRAVMGNLIKTAPDQAIASTIPATVRAQLPPEVAAELEDRISGKGNLALIGVNPAPGQTVDQSEFRSLTIGDQNYTAYVSDRRSQQATKVDISVSGVALDGNAAVSDSPLRVLDPGETPATQEPVHYVCPVSAQTSASAGSGSSPLNVQQSTAVEVGGQVFVLCCVSHVPVLESRLIAAEDAAGPYPGAVDAGLTAADGRPGTSGVAGRPPLSWSTGAKKVLTIRVDFSDMTGAPVMATTPHTTIDAAFATNVFSQTNGVSDFYSQCSYGLTSLTLASADVTPVYRMPKTAAAYATGNLYSQIQIDAQAAATTGGYTVSNYDRIVVVFSDMSGIAGSQFTWSGLGDIQGNRVWVNGYWTFHTLCHELGHSYGLQHCNLWQVSDGNPVSPTGQSIEYGDPFGMMNSGTGDYHYQFDMWEKSILHWIPDTSVTTVSTAGTYRVYRFDHPSANTANPLALKIVRNSSQDYWIGFRQLITTNTSLMNGAYILWGYNQVVQGNLLDMTTSGTSAQDAPLAIGASFHDVADGITIQPLDKGGTTPNEYLDVQIGFDTQIQWQATTYNVDQQSGTAILTLTRGSNSTGAVSIQYSTADGTALAGTHYTATSGTVSWANGDNAPKTISIPITTSASFSGLKTFTVNLSGIIGGVLLNSPTATVNIASPGTPDPGFLVDFVNSTINKVLVQPDGKLVIGGYFSSLEDSSFVIYPRSGVGRLNADGSVDTTFVGGTGVDVTPVYAMALQPNGQILICGNFAKVNGVSCPSVARLNTDGSLDTTFNPGTGANGIVYAMALQPDGKIVVGGAFTTFAGSTRTYLARLNTNGSVDTSFTGPGFVATGGWSVNALALQPDGKVVVGGQFYFSTAPQRAGIVRTGTNGALDTTFSTGLGAYLNGSTGSLRQVNTIAVQRDGQVIIGGNFTAYNGTARPYIARLSSAGVLDTTFAPVPDNKVFSVLVQADSKVLISGSFANMNGTAKGHLARVTATGATDTAFNGGVTSTAAIYDLEMQADGLAVAAGDYGTYSGDAGVTMTRFFTGMPGLPGTVQFSSSTYAAAEGTTLTVTATRTGGSYGAISMNYATIPGTAASTRYTPVAGTLSWANGDATSKTFTVSILNDGTTQPDQYFNLNLGIPIGGVIPSLPGTTAVTVTTPVGAWKYAHFTTTQLADSTISGNTANPTGDGTPNLLKYAFGLDPMKADYVDSPTTAIQNISGQNYLTLTFRKSPTATDLTYTPQSGAPIGTWNGTPVIVGTPTTNADGSQTVTYRDSVTTSGTTQRFMRLQVTLSP